MLAKNIIKLTSFKPKLETCFNMGSVITGLQDDLVNQTLRKLRIEYKTLEGLIKSNPSNRFYQKVQSIFELIFHNPEVMGSNEANLLLLYFIQHYFPIIDVSLNNDDIEVNASPNHKDDIASIAILNLLLSEYKKILDIQDVKLIDLAYQILVMYEVV